MTQKNQNEKLIDKAFDLLEAGKTRQLRALLKKFPASLRQQAEEFDLQIIASEDKPEKLSKAFDKYLERYENVRLSNLEIAVRLKIDLIEYDQALEIADRILIEDQYNQTAINSIYVVFVNTKQKEKAYETATKMLEVWEMLDKDEEHLVDAKLKILLAATTLSMFHEAADRWSEVCDHQDSYPHLFASEHYACALRSLANLGRTNDAVAVLDSLGPDMRSSDNVIGAIPSIWFFAGEREKCYEAYDEMESSTVDKVEQIWNRGLSRLGFGDIEEGLEDYEIRWKWADFPSAKRLFANPLWMGEDLTDKRILIWNEQGIGDQLLFLTLLPVVLSKNPTEVVVEVSKKIIPLVQRWYPEVTVQSDGVVDTIGHQNYERFDFNIPSGTLMLRQFEEHGEIPKCRRLMRVPQNAKEKLLPANIANKRIVLGVSWRSHLITDARIGNYMSVHSILRLLELLPDDIGLVCLQYSLRDDERELLEPYENVHIPDYDFFEEVDTNAFYAGVCDLVLTAGTVNLQLAGMYGVPVLTWLPDRDWVLLGQKHYPWFENVVVVRGAVDWSQTAMLYALVDKLKVLLRIN